MTLEGAPAGGPAAEPAPAAAMLPPGRVIGIIGGGQLGRMLALAAARLGYRTHVYSPEADAPAMQVTDRATLAGYEDREALLRFAAAVDVATYEFENIPGGTAQVVAERVAVRPSPAVLAICQDRVEEKTFLNGIGVPTAPFRPVASPDDVARALAALGRPAVLKRARLGYDGKGQVLIRGETPAAAWAAMLGEAGGRAAGVLEGWIDFEREISVLVARGADGGSACYVPVENLHEHHILRRTIAPAAVTAAVAAAADAIARRIAEAIGLVGLMCVEMFVGRDGSLLVNELAPRPHNSGHWTIDACVVSQFEQCIRAVAGLPLGSPERHADAVMENLLGDEVERWPQLLRDPAAHLHLYGKGEARPGRKMGHVTWIRPRRCA
jgi:5-(carboxyamino)imidazole ribonucleotide synthase